jgi:hypothetical protein
MESMFEYNDDVPYFVRVGGQRHLVVPYTADVNDFRFDPRAGYSEYLRHNGGK